METEKMSFKCDVGMAVGQLMLFGIFAKRELDGFRVGVSGDRKEEKILMIRSCVPSWPLLLAQEKAKFLHFHLEDELWIHFCLWCKSWSDLGWK